MPQSVGLYHEAGISGHLYLNSDAVIIHKISILALCLN
jgi:hypothetical protein